MNDLEGTRARLSSAEAAVSAIKDGCTVAISGSGGGLLEADAVLSALGERFRATGHPRDLSLIHALGIGDGKGSGLARIAQTGLLRRVIGGHWSWSREMQALAAANEIEAYTLPAGVIMTLFREIGARRPGVITRIGLGTFADPLLGGGKCNEVTTEDIVSHIEIDGETYLHYKPHKIDVAILRGSCADMSGNITLVHEAADLDAYAVALAGRSSGGTVIVQVKSTQEHPFVPARLARIPGVLVDHVVVAPAQAQTQLGEYDPSISGEEAPTGEILPEAASTGLRRIIAERAANELKPRMSVNFGFGIPAGIPGIMAERGQIGSFWASVEQGIHNGQMLDGALFGAARYPQAIVSSVDQFDFYSGGGIDVAFLGMGELDGEGNVNVSMLGLNIVGPGGFVDITQGARRVVFCGSFEAKGLEVELDAESRLTITSPGAIPKLVERVLHVTFSGKRARETGQEVLYITERAVFRLAEAGLELIEVADGIDIERDVLGRMRFHPLIGDIRPMRFGKAA